MQPTVSSLLAGIACAAVVLASACGGGDSKPDLAGPLDDLSLVASDGGIVCGTASLCNIENGNLCCVEPQYEFCGSPESCSSGVALYCNGPADCSGEVCCLVSASLGACVPMCNGTVLCRTDSDCPTATPHCCTPLTSGSSEHLACAASCT